MKIRVEGGKLICIFLLTLAAAVSSQNKCPFTHVYHFGDGFTDIGNSIHVDPKSPNPARLPPFGLTHPGWPSGRWCDGLVDFDYTVIDFGLPNVVPFLTSAPSTDNDGVIFSAARSPVLPFSYFLARGIVVPSYAAPVKTQLKWFKTYLKSTCKTKRACANLLENALLLTGDIEGNDLGYALTQGKSIEEVKTYVPDIVNELIDFARELLKLGATKIIFPGNGPIGCAPHILSALWTVDSDAYDELGCLKSVNELVEYKNAVLQEALACLQAEFPNALVPYSPMYEGLRALIQNATVIGSDGINKALKACCGVGGRYNFDSNRFCGPGVPVCPNPNEYIYWDGYHFTQQLYYAVEQLLVPPGLDRLNCTTSTSARSSKRSTF